MNIANLLRTGVQLSLVLTLVSAIALLSTSYVDEDIPTPQWKPALIASGMTVPVPAKKPSMHTNYKSHQIAPATFDMMTIKVSRLFVVEDEDDVKAEHIVLSSAVTKEIIAKSDNVTGKADSGMYVPQSLSSVSKSVNKLVRRGRPEEALSYVYKNFPEKPADKSLEYDRMMAHIAAGFLYQGRLTDALALSEAVLNRPRLDIPEASWVAGLSLWQMDKPSQAAVHFDNASISAHASDMLAASASYWAARAYGRIDQTDKQDVALNRAAQFSETFYGILAMQ